MNDKALLVASCRIRGRMVTRTSITGKPHHFDFEVHLPFQWRGRQPYQGDGAYDGALLSAMDALTMPGNALNRSFAVFTTDAGHHVPTEELRCGFGCR